MKRFTARRFAAGALLTGLLIGLLSACVPAPLRAQPHAQLQVQTSLVPAPIETVTGAGGLYREPGPAALQVRSDRAAFVTAVVVAQSGGAQVIAVGPVTAGTLTAVALPAALGFTQVFTVTSLAPLDLSAATGARTLKEVAAVVQQGAARLPAGSYTVATTVYRVARFGTLEITASRPGAEVRVEGRRVGSAPLTLRDVPEGQVTVEVSATGCDSVSQTVNVAANATARVTATLFPETGTLRVDSALSARVLIEGQDAGITPLRFKVRPGVVNVNVVPLDASVRAETLLVRVQAGRTTTIACQIAVQAWQCGTR